MMSKHWKDPIHPGEILADELEEIGVNANELAKRLGIPHGRIYEILREERAITASTALRLGKFFNINPEFWLNLQKKYDLEVAEKKEAKKLKSIKPLKIKKSKVLEEMRA
ncbi:MAG: HigA family addiction module antitoxin [Nitrospinaceae bacterium]